MFCPTRAIWSRFFVVFSPHLLQIVRMQVEMFNNVKDYDAIIAGVLAKHKLNHEIHIKIPN